MEQEIVQFYLKGYSIQKVSDHFQVGFHKVYTVLTQNNVLRKPGPTPKYKRAVIQKMAAKGLTVPQIAKKLNANPVSIRNFAKVNKIQVPRARQKPNKTAPAPPRRSAVAKPKPKRGRPPKVEPKVKKDQKVAKTKDNVPKPEISQPKIIKLPHDFIPSQDLQPFVGHTVIPIYPDFIEPRLEELGIRKFDLYKTLSTNQQHLRKIIDGSIPIRAYFLLKLLKHLVWIYPRLPKIKT